MNYIVQVINISRPTIWIALYSIVPSYLISIKIWQKCVNLFVENTALSFRYTCCHLLLFGKFYVTSSWLKNIVSCRVEITYTYVKCILEITKTMIMRKTTVRELWMDGICEEQYGILSIWVENTRMMRQCDKSSILAT